MHWMEFTLAVIDKITWPGIVLIALLILHKPLQALLPSTQSVKYKDFELNFSQQLEKISEQASTDLPPLPPIDKLTLTKNAQFLPNQSILQAWVKVDKSAEQLLLKHLPNIHIHQEQRYKFIGQSLLNHHLITNKQAKLFNELRQLRNKVAHAPDYEVNTVLALQYIDLCFALIEAFETDSSIKNVAG